MRMVLRFAEATSTHAGSADCSGIFLSVLFLTGVHEEDLLLQRAGFVPGGTLMLLYFACSRLHLLYRDGGQPCAGYYFMAGLIIGIAAQRTRLCMVGGIRT